MPSLKGDNHSERCRDWHPYRGRCIPMCRMSPERNNGYTIEPPDEIPSTIRPAKKEPWFPYLLGGFTLIAVSALSFIGGALIERGI